MRGDGAIYLHCCFAHICIACSGKQQFVGYMKECIYQRGANTNYWFLHAANVRRWALQ